MEDDPLSDPGGGNGDQDMPDANKQPGDHDPAGSGPVPMQIPNETQEGAQLGDDQVEAGDDEEPQEPQEPLEPYQIVLQGFLTVSQTLLAAYGAVSAEIQIIIWKSLAKTTAEDRTFVWGPPGPFPMDRLCQAGNCQFRGKHQGPSPTTGRGSAGWEGCPRNNS